MAPITKRLSSGCIFGLGLMTLTTMLFYRIHEFILDPDQSSDARFLAAFLPGTINIFGGLVFHLGLPDVESAFLRSLAFASIGLNVAFAWQLWNTGLHGSFTLYTINASWFAYLGFVVAALTEFDPPRRSPASQPTVVASLKGVDEQLAAIQQRIDRMKATVCQEKTPGHAAEGHCEPPTRS